MEKIKKLIKTLNNKISKLENKDMEELKKDKNFMLQVEVMNLYLGDKNE